MFEFPNVPKNKKQKKGKIENLQVEVNGQKDVTSTFHMHLYIKASFFSFQFM